MNEYKIVYEHSVPASESDYIDQITYNYACSEIVHVQSKGNHCIKPSGT